LAPEAQNGVEPPSSTGGSHGSHGSAGSKPGSGSGTGTGGSSGLHLKNMGQSACIFWLGSRAYAIDTALVGEAVTVESVAPVPLAPPAVMGLFNLRGQPMALVDLATILGLNDIPPREGQTLAALVIKTQGLLSAVVIDRMEQVLAFSRGRFRARNEADDHPVIQGFLEVDIREGLVVTVLDPVALVARFEQLKYRR
jgi:chemotaxis signal transduction protein